jgi:tetratricopeptide (TPR) repeat protein
LSASDALPNIAANRSIEPAKLTKSLRGDPDWLVMKALEKDRARRYDTAISFARDIQRYLADEVVEARPPSAAYRLNKFLRRNKASVTAAGLILLAVLGGMVGTSLGLVRARAAEALAKQRLADVITERDAKEAARKDAVAVTNFLETVFRSPDPQRDGRTITVAETLDAAVKQMDSDLTAQPAERARLRAVLGRTYSALGLPRQAIPLEESVLDYYRGAVGLEDARTLGAMDDLGQSYINADRRDEALKLADEVVRLRPKVSGPEHGDTILGMIRLAAARLIVGRVDEAIPLQLEAIELSRKVNGPEHADTLSALSNLAQFYSAAGRREEALKLQEEVLALRRKVLGPEHLDTLGVMHNLAGSYADADRRDEALKMREDVLAQFRTRLGPEHHDTLLAQQFLATSYDEVGRLPDALKIREEVLAVRRKVSGPEPDTILAVNALAASYTDSGQLGPATALLKEALPVARKRVPHDTMLMGVILSGLGSAEFKSGAFADAGPHLREGLAILEKLASKSLAAANCRSELGGVLLQRKDYTEAEPLLLSSVAAMKRREKPIPPGRRDRLTNALDRLIDFYTATNKPDEATKWRQERAKYGGVAPAPPQKR